MKRLVAVVVVLVVAVGAVLVARERASSPGPTTPSAPPPPAPRPAVHAAYTFQLDTRSAAHVDGQGGDVEAALMLDAALDVALTSGAGGTDLLVVKLEQVRDQRFTVNGGPAQRAELDAAKQQLEGATVYADRAPTGVITAVRFGPGTSGPAMEALSRIAYAFGAAQAAGDFDEESPSGKRRVRYTAAPSGEAGAFVRTTQQYLELRGAPSVEGAVQQVAGGGTVRFSGGALVQVDEEEQLELRSPQGTQAWSSWAKWSLARVGQPAQASVVLPASLETFRGSAPAAKLTPEQLRARDARLAKDVTVETVLGWLTAASAGGTLPDGAAMRAAAFLRLHPEACAYLTAEYRAGRVAKQGLGLGLDMLAMAGHATAQGEMRTILSLPKLREDTKAFPHLAQRFIFVDSPTHETADYVAGLMQDGAQKGDPRLRRAAAVALGAVAHHLATSDPAKAQALDQQLVDSLAKSQTPADKAAVLAAMGNAGTERGAKAIITAAADPSFFVREQAANSLRNVHSKEATAALVTMAADADWSVQRTAWRSLRAQTLEGADWSALAQAHAGGRVDRRAYGDVLDVVLSHRDSLDSDAVRAMLERIAQETAQGEPVLRDRARELLAAARP